MRALDVLVLAGYFAALAYIGWSSRVREDNARDMLVGDRQIPWWAVLLSVLGTEISALTFVGVPAFAYTGNWTYLQVTLGAIGGRYLVGRYFLPAFYRHNVVSIYEFLLRRYGPRTRNMAVLVFLFTRILMSGVRLGAGAVILHLALGISSTHAVWVLAAVGLVFCAAGGIRAVVWTEVMQVSVMLLGALCAVLVLAGGLHSWEVPAGSMQVLDFRLEPGLEFTFWACLLGTTLTNTAIFGTDYDMVQRMLTAKNSQQSRWAVFGSGLAEVPICLLFLSIGTLLRLYYLQHPDPNLPSAAKEVFGYFIVHQLPAGLCGLLVAAVVSVVLSTYESALAALAGSFVVDFYKPTLKPHAPPGHYLVVTRLATVGFALLLLVVAIQSQHIDQILKFGLEVGTYFYGALLAVFAIALIQPEERQAGPDLWTAVVAMPLSIVLVLWVKTHTSLAFPWFVSLGAVSAASLILLGRLFGQKSTNWSQYCEIEPL
ncbi:sodium/solute symporter [bacterium]|nr:sodium/solute symporter [bacterium]